MRLKREIEYPVGPLKKIDPHVYCITHGEYSDYVLAGMYISDEEVDWQARKKEYVSKYPEQDPDREGTCFCCFNENRFVEWLVFEGHIRRFDATVVHLGSYGSGIITVTGPEDET